MTRQEKIQIASLVLTVVVIFFLVIAIVMIVKYSEEIKSNPIEYAIDNSEIVSCVCYNDLGQSASYGEEQKTFFNIE